jgi:hypothetical protein
MILTDVVVIASSGALFGHTVEDVMTGDGSLAVGIEGAITAEGTQVLDVLHLAEAPSVTRFLQVVTSTTEAKTEAVRMPELRITIVMRVIDALRASGAGQASDPATLVIIPRFGDGLATVFMARILGDGAVGIRVTLLVARVVAFA